MVFFSKARLNISLIVDKKHGRLLTSLDPGMIRHVKLDTVIMACKGIKALVRSMRNLETCFYDPKPYLCFSNEDEADALCELDDCPCEECWSPDWTDPICDYTTKIRKMAIETFQDGLFDSGNSRSIVGRCNPEVCFGEDHCVENLGFHRFIIGWDWMGQPFRLVAECHIEFESPSIRPIDVVSPRCEACLCHEAKTI
jgi:hypothetical protein